jgi:hypothetical protein
MIGTLAAASAATGGKLPGISNSGPISAPAGPATSGDAYSGGSQGNISINTGGSKSGVPWWGWALMATAAGGGVLWFMKGRA